MTLRHRTALAVLASCALAAIVLYFALQSVLAARFTTVERQKADQDLGRATIALNQDISGLDTTVGDWASWDETYQFMQDGNAEYIAGNLGESTFSRLGIDFVVFVNNAGQVAYSEAIDASDGTRTPILPSLEQHVTGESILAKHPDKAEQRGRDTAHARARRPGGIASRSAHQRDGPDCRLTDHGPLPG